MKNYIKEISQSRDVYPATSAIAYIQDNLTFVSYPLHTFLVELFLGYKALKIATIGQAIVQVTRPKTVIALLQIDLRIQMHNRLWF